MTSPPADDAALVRRVADGDRQAFLQLYDRYASRVYGLALHILRDAMAAEEVTQDAFVKLWEKAATFDLRRGSVATWLLTITRRTAIDRLRHEARRPPLADPPPEGPGWPTPQPDAGTLSEEARWMTVRFALADLPLEQRQAITLAFYYGLSHRQIAEHLGLPLGTVKTRIRLGMEKLRRALREDHALEQRSERPASGVSSKGGNPE